MSKKTQSKFDFSGLARYYIARIKERLWIRPLLSCLFSVVAVLAAGLADTLDNASYFPDIGVDSLEKLLTIMSSSMLVIAMFAVGAMLSAYASASASATPRSFPLVVNDDISQNALSTFIGSFIFSIIGLVALLNDYYDSAGRFILFLMTAFVFSIVILGFVRWVDRIARLGRLGHIIKKVESATDNALQFMAKQPRMGAKPIQDADEGIGVYAKEVGYVQNIDIPRLQRIAEELDCMVNICTPAGSFVTPDRALARLDCPADEEKSDDIIDAFVIGKERTFECDPGFGLIVMSQISSRALSSGINDSGTAIDIIGSLIRLFVRWSNTLAETQEDEIKYKNVGMPELDVDEMFDDAFSATARDGAGSIEVAIRIQKAYVTLSKLEHDEIRKAAQKYSKQALQYADNASLLEEEMERLKSLSKDVC